MLDRVARGEVVIVTRDGGEVAELRPCPRWSVSATELISRRRNLPQIDPVTWRRDLDELLDPAL